MGGAGLIFLTLAIYRACECRAALAVLGVAHVAVSAYLLHHHLMSGQADPGGRPTRASRRAELVTLILAAPYCGLLTWLAIADPRPPIQTISGKPVEVRSETRAVYMPGGQVFGYVCWKKEGRGGGTCPAEARWAALPRWPEPQHVRMEVSGDRIRGLTMDGEVIVDPAEFRGEHGLLRVFAALFGLGGCILAIRGAVRRIRTLRAQG